MVRTTRWRIVLAALVAAAAGAGACSGNVNMSSGSGEGGAGTGAGTTTGTGGTGHTSTTSIGSATGGASTTSGTGGTGGGLGPGQCHSATDCKAGFEECLAPGAFPGCGICFMPPDTCTGDAQCKAQQATSICVPVQCACMGQMACAPGCTSDGMCGAGEVCAADNHCQPKPCSATPGCPVNFVCGAAGCQRKPCTTDAACQGYCVDGACYDMPGTCTPIPA